VSVVALLWLAAAKPGKFPHGEQQSYQQHAEYEDGWK
jgi:hypothetical protein